jgi:CRP/FNR family transcriptional regulator, cyclic AMP receptor protein
MLKKIFGVRAASTVAPSDASSAKELQVLDAELLVGFLREAKSIIPLTQQEAKIAASYMRARQYATGQVIIKEGDKTNTNYMLWILDGETTFEAAAAHESGPIVVTVLGPGTALGEMGLMDGAARSLTCTASAPTRCAVLTRLMLQNMCADHPEVAAKLMSIICIGISARLRDLTEKFKRYVRLNNAMNQELHESMPMQRLR